MTHPNVPESLESITRFVALIQAALDRGELPCLADARLIRSRAQLLELEIEKLHVDAIRERTPEQDRRAQVDMAEMHGRQLCLV